MKQKIVIQMQLDCDKCRSKALKIAAQERGVSSVALEGDGKNKLVVTGEVDAVCLARVLRKKFQCVTLVSVQEVKEEEESRWNLSDNKDVCYVTAYCPPPPCGVPPPYGPYYYPVCDQYPSNCSVM